MLASSTSPPATLPEIRGRLRTILRTHDADPLWWDVSRLANDIDAAIADQGEPERAREGPMTREEIAEHLDRLAMRVSVPLTVDHTALAAAVRALPDPLPAGHVAVAREELDDLREQAGWGRAIWPHANALWAVIRPLVVNPGTSGTLPDAFKDGIPALLADYRRLKAYAETFPANLTAIADVKDRTIREVERLRKAEVESLRAELAQQKEGEHVQVENLEAEVERLKAERRQFNVEWNNLVDMKNRICIERDGLLAQLADAREATRQGMVDAGYVEPIDPAAGHLKPFVMSVFHRAWTRNVGEPGYDKNRWLDMESRLLLAVREFES